MKTILLLSVICGLTSIISVVTGSTSLITVPVLVQWGLEPRMAVATNMFALIGMSLGGSVPFLRTSIIDRRRLPPLLVLTAMGSLVGAGLVVVIPASILSLIIVIAMISVTLFMILNRHAKAGLTTSPSRTAQYAGYGATLVLGIYGGLFSGGYVTLLTAAYVTLFGMSLLQAVATTKVINVVSSAIASLIFASQGLIDYPLGLWLGALMFGGGLLGARLTLWLKPEWLRVIFVTTVVVLAFKMLFDSLAGTPR